MLRSLIRYLVIASMTLGGLLGCFSGEASATEWTGANWMDGLVQVEELGGRAYTDGEEREVYSDITCKYMDLKYNAGSKLHPRYSTIRTCMYPSSNGYVNPEYAQFDGEELRQVINKWGTFANGSSFYINSGSPGMAYITNAYDFYGSNTPELHYTRDWRNVFKYSHVANNGEVQRRSDFQYDFKLAYPNGNKIGASVSAVSYSKNGRWLRVDAGAKQLRINTSTFEVFSYAPARWYQYSRFSAVSNSGRFIVEGNSSDKYYIYDLERCEEVKPDLAPRNCTKRELGPLVKAAYQKTMSDPTQLEAFSVKTFKFISDSVLEQYVWVKYRGDKDGKNVHFRVSVESSEAPFRYLALGDSFSSGEGAGSYWNTTDFYADEDNFNMCHLSKVSYPYLLQQTVSAEWAGSVACSGAITWNIANSLRDYDYYKDSQAKFSTSIEDPDEREEHITQSQKNYINSGTPGYVAQKRHIEEESSGVSTISIGGNDIGFKDIIIACAAQPECYSRRDARESMADLIVSKIPDLKNTFMAVKNSMSGENPRLYVLGYPKILSEADWCGSVFSPRERQFANSLVEYLNSAIQIAAQGAGVRYVDVSDAFIDYSSGRDYRLCGDAKLRAVNSLIIRIASSSLSEPLGKRLQESYHPNALGHVLLARKVRERTNNLQQLMPDNTGSNVNAPDMSLYMSLVGDTDDKIRQRTKLDPRLVPNPVLFKDELNPVVRYRIDTVNDIPAKSTTARVQLHSEPTDIGTLPISAEGEIMGEVSIPDTIEPGYHELHVYYTDVLDRQVDVYQHVFIAHTRDDYDGDGIPNSQEVCVIGEPSGIDYDKDGIDDMCDAHISLTEEHTQSEPVELNPTIEEAAIQGVLTLQEVEMIRRVSLEPRVDIDPVNSTQPPGETGVSVRPTQSSISQSNTSRKDTETSDSIELYTNQGIAWTGWAVGGSILAVMMVGIMILLKKRYYS